MSVSVPLGSRRRSDFSVAEADYELTSLKYRRQAQMLEMRQELFGIYQQLKQAQSEVESVRQRQLPKAQQAFDQSRRGFEEGRFSFLVLSQAQQRLFDLRERKSKPPRAISVSWSRPTASPLLPWTFAHEPIRIPDPASTCPGCVRWQRIVATSKARGHCCDRRRL